MLLFPQHRLEHSEWDSAQAPIIGSCGTQEQAVLIDLPGNSCQKVRREEGFRGSTVPYYRAAVLSRESRRRKVQFLALIS